MLEGYRCAIELAKLLVDLKLDASGQFQPSEGVAAQKGVALTEASNANCNFNSYWNCGPAVTAETNRARGTATIRYKCGHVEG